MNQWNWLALFKTLKKNQKKSVVNDAIDLNASLLSLVELSLCKD